MEIAQKRIMCYTKQKGSLLSKDTLKQHIEKTIGEQQKTDNSENKRLSSIEKAI